MIVLCGCEAHQSNLAQCSCLCDDHDKHFERSVVIVREALRHQASELYRLQQQMGNVTHRLRRVEDELSSSHNAWQPPSNEAVSSPPITGNDTTYWPPNPRESDGDLLARLGTDAVKWAEEFVRLFGGNVGVLTGWFANAIGAGEMKNAVALDYLRFLTGPDWRERAQRWFETTYLGRDAMTVEHESDGMTDEEAHDALMDVLREDRAWVSVPLDSMLDPDAQIRLTIVGPAGEGWDGARAATEFLWDDAHTVTVEVLDGVGIIEDEDNS